MIDAIINGINSGDVDTTACAMIHSIPAATVVITAKERSSTTATMVA